MNGGDCGLTVFNLLDGDKVSVHTVVELDFMLNRFVSCSHGNIAHGHVQNLLITGFVYISGINPFLKLISFNVGSGSGSGDNCRICNFGSVDGFAGYTVDIGNGAGFVRMNCHCIMPHFDEVAQLVLACEAADEMIANNTVTADDDGLGYITAGVEHGAKNAVGTEVHPSVTVVLKEFLCGRGGTAVAFTDDADELNIRLGSGGVILVHCLNVGHFGSARTAPCCPIVDECEISILQNVTGDGVAVKVNCVKIADVHADTGFASGICRFRFGGHEGEGACCEDYSKQNGEKFLHLPLPSLSDFWGNSIPHMPLP